MNISLSEALAQLNLRPGQIERVPVHDYEVVIRRPLFDEKEMAESIMLEPWATFSHGTAGTIVEVKQGNPHLPDPPIIPPDDEFLK